jgi:hypothetical protein
LAREFRARGITITQRPGEFAVNITACLETQSYACRETLLGLADRLGMDGDTIKRAMRHLRQASAIAVNQVCHAIINTM